MEKWRRPKEKQEGRKGARQEGGSRFAVVKREDNGGKGDGWKGKKGASRGW